METDLDRIKEITEEKSVENQEFRVFLKRCELSSEEIDSIVHRLYDEVSEEIDCESCRNCCRELRPVLNTDDVERFSTGLHLSPDEFKKRYLIECEEGEGYKFEERPCPFLKDDGCEYPDLRPEDCISFPHIQKEEFVYRSMEIVKNCSVCPIVFNVYERLKEEIWSREKY